MQSAALDNPLPEISSSLNGKNFPEPCEASKNLLYGNIPELKAQMAGEKVSSEVSDPPKTLKLVPNRIVAIPKCKRTKINDSNWT